MSFNMGNIDGFWESEEKTIFFTIKKELFLFIQA